MSTLTEMNMLFNQMKIGVHAEKLVKFSEKHVGFYMEYAFTVSRTLKEPQFRKFLRWMLKKENIKQDKVTNVEVVLLPFQKKNGNGLAGRCNSRGEIRIYPKRLGFCRKLIRKCGEEGIYSYIKNRARASLIHELLHLKYLNDEEKVRKLTRKYFNIFTKHRNKQNSDANNISKVLLEP